MSQVKGRYEDTKNGYIKLYLSDGRVIEEHRFKMERKLGRRLQYNEVVHHKNDNKHDNRTRNLEVKTRSKHARDHVKEPVMENLVCPQCGKAFTRRKSRTDFDRRHGQKDFFCTRICMAKTFGRGRPRK